MIIKLMIVEKGLNENTLAKRLYHCEMLGLRENVMIDKLVDLANKKNVRDIPSQYLLRLNILFISSRNVKRPIK